MAGELGATGDSGLGSISPVSRLLEAARLGIGGGVSVADELPSAGEAVRDGGLGITPEPMTGVSGRDSGNGILEGVPGRTTDAESLLAGRGGIGGGGVDGVMGRCVRFGEIGEVGMPLTAGYGEGSSGEAACFSF